MARWRSDGKELMFVNGVGAIVTVDVAPGPAFQAGAPRRLFQLPLELLALSPNRGTLVDVTRDGRRLLLIMPVQESAQRELGVSLNWQEMRISKICVQRSLKPGRPTGAAGAPGWSFKTCVCTNRQRTRQARYRLHWIPVKRDSAS